MDQYAYKGKLVYLINQFNGQVIYSESPEKTKALESVGADKFFSLAKKIANPTKKVITVAGIKPTFSQKTEDTTKTQEISKTENINNVTQSTKDGVIIIKDDNKTSVFTVKKGLNKTQSKDNNNSNNGEKDIYGE